MIEDPWQLHDVPNHIKTQEMCGNAVFGVSYSLQYVRNCFVTQELVEIWRDDQDYCDNDELFEWYNSHRQSKSCKKETKSC